MDAVTESFFIWNIFRYTLSCSFWLEEKSAIGLQDKFVELHAENGNTAISFAIDGIFAAIGFCKSQQIRVALSRVGTSLDVLSSFRGGYIFEYFTV